MAFNPFNKFRKHQKTMLAVLAIPRWIPLLVWMTVDAYLWWPRLGYFLGLAEPGQGNSAERFLTVVLIRDALVLVLCAMVVRTIYRPESDPVRRDGVTTADPPVRRKVAAIISAMSPSRRSSSR